MAQFKNMLRLRNDGGTEFQPTPSIELCRGDIVRIKAGDKIPADIRVISASDDMKVEQSALTGEPDNIKKHPECTNEKNPLETNNLLFFGTLCPSGSCEGIVVNIGDNTVMGRISAITTQTEDGISPIKKEINRFVLLVSAVAIFLGVTFFIIGAVLKTDPITNLVFMIGIIVANVPEGLLATVTVCLSLTAQRMYHKNVLVKQLESVETLGSTSCICSGSHAPSSSAPAPTPGSPRRCCTRNVLAVIRDEWVQGSQGAHWSALHHINILVPLVLAIGLQRVQTVEPLVPCQYQNGIMANVGDCGGH